MNIRKLLPHTIKTENNRYAGSFKRTVASLIDAWITIFLYALTMNILSRFWLEKKFITLKENFITTFQTDIPKNTPEHLNFIINSDAFLCFVISIFITIAVGGLYHAYFNSSSWAGTFGKRITRIIILRENGLKISFLRGIAHYFLSILPFGFIAYLLSYKAQHQISFFKAILASEFNVFLTLLFVIWIQIQVFTRKKTTVYDMICNTVLFNGRAKEKFPWSKKI